MRTYGDKVIFIGLPGEDGEANMREFIKQFKLENMVSVVDTDTDIRRQFGARFRGTWIYIDDDGGVSRSSPHPPEADGRKNLDRLVAG